MCDVTSAIRGRVPRRRLLAGAALGAATLSTTTADGDRRRFTGDEKTRPRERVVAAYEAVRCCSAW